jgi:hypothetical protein
VGREEVFVEIVTFGPDENREFQEAHQQRHAMHLLGLASAPVYWEGHVPGYLNQADEARWIQATTDAAARCAQTGQPVEVPGPEGHVLVIRPGVPPPGTGLSGPELTLNFSTRMARILDRKGAQTRGAGIAWIWIEDYGGIHALHPFTRMPLAAKINGLARIARDALADRPPVAGIAWSGLARCMQVPPDDQAETEAGVAFQRGLPIEHVRQTVIVTRNLIVPGHLGLLARACDREPQWLDWALHRLGVTAGVGSLLAQPPGRQAYHPAMDTGSAPITAG